MFSCGQRVNNCDPISMLWPSRKQNGGFELASLEMFSRAVYLKNTTGCKRDEKYTEGNKNCYGNPLGKFLNLKSLTLYCFNHKIQ
jgi:hypothetical protein